MNTHFESQTEFAKLNYTLKAHKAINSSNSDLTIRERQLLILKKSKSHLCDADFHETEAYSNACESLLSKVDLNSLIERGYLSPQPQDDSASFEVDIYNEGNSEPDESLRFLAGYA